MKKLALILVTSIFLSGCTVKNLFVKKPAGLEISTSSAASVYLGDKNLGSTPISNQNIAPGTYTLRIIPDDTTLAPYEATLDMKPAVSTIIARTFGTTSLDSFGNTLTLIPDQIGKTVFSVISDPDTANLTIDGVPSGFTPLSKREIAPGSHEIIVGTPGFAEQKISVKTAKDYNLVVSLKLKAESVTLTPPSPSPVATSSAELSPASPAPLRSPLASSAAAPTLTLDPPYVTVSDSPDVQSTGGLNVRKEPSSVSDPLGKARVGERLKYLGETTTAGWHKVEFEGSAGYVSAKYAILTK